MHTSLLLAALTSPHIACGPPTLAPIEGAPDPDPVAPTPGSPARAELATAPPAAPVSPASGDLCADLRTATGAAMAQFSGWKLSETPESEAQGDTVFATGFVLPGATACHVIAWQDMYEGGLGVRYECELGAPASVEVANRTADAWAAKVEGCKLPDYLPHHVTDNETRYYHYSAPAGASSDHEIAVQIIAESAFMAGGEVQLRRTRLVVRRNVL